MFDNMEQSAAKGALEIVTLFRNGFEKSIVAKPTFGFGRNLSPQMELNDMVYPLLGLVKLESPWTAPVCRKLARNCPDRVLRG